MTSYETLNTFILELDSAIKICNDIKNTIASYSDKELSERINFFAITLPIYKFISDERNDILLLIRMIAAKEIKQSDGISTIQKISAELNHTRKLITI